MSDTLDIFGTRYTNVTGIIATDSGGNELTYTRGGGQPTLQTKTATYTPTESQQTATITADTGYDGLEEVDITVNAVSSTYVGTGITRRSSTDLTASGATVTVPSGYYASQASKSVASMTLPSTTSDTETGVCKADIFPSTAMTTYLNIPAGYNATAQFYQIRALMLDGKTITSNGTYYAGDDDIDGFSSVTVSVTSPAPSLQTKTATYTPTESQQTATITADSGYDGLSSVGVTVNAISSSYVGSGISRRSSSDLTVSGATVTVPSGYYASQASKAVASGTAGTPTATKGTVSNHSISVTPSVTNTTGYITGSTKTGTAVTVTASELVSGSETKTANGTYDVTNLASLVVAVPIVTYYTGSSTPASSLGSNGDIYLKTA